MTSNKKSVLSCRVISAVPEDVDQAFQDLKRDMNPKYVHVFLDKIKRYSIKPDRALFLARYKGKNIGFATIINKSPAPDNSDKETITLFQGYACGTGLMVLPEFRHKGVASKLVLQWEIWARQKHLSGIWLVTRKTGDWYQRFFHYSLHGTTIRKGVKKTILTKTLR
jgi:GNAT superfamily N-acetyltransferase